MSSFFSLNFGDGTSIRDNSNNELLTFDVNGSAVNNLEITNNAAGSNVSLNVIGSDTDIGLNLNPKGHGKVNILGSTSNAGGIRFYGNGATDDSTYVGLTANTDVSSNINFVLPSSDGTSGQVLQTDGIGNLSFIDASSGSGTPGGADTQIQFNDAGSFGAISTFTTDATNLTLSGGNLTLGSGDEIQFVDGNEKISGDGSNLTVNSGRSILLNATSNVVVPSSIPLSFATDDAEKITGDGTDLTVTSGGAINLTATTDVNVPSGIGVTFGDAGENIVGDGADLYVNSSNSINLAPSANVTITSGKNLEFGVGSGETISGDGTDLTVTSGNIINLTPSATANVVVTTGSLVLSTESITSGLSTTEGSPTAKAVTSSVSYYNVGGTDALYTTVEGNPATNGQLWHVLFNQGSSETLRIDFGSNGLATGSGLSQYLTFSTTGQSATVLYMATKWRIINTGAAVS